MKKSLGPKTIAYPYPVFVVGAYDKDGRPNIMTSSWTGICCSQPPCIYVSLREATYTFGCIKHSKAFTVNIPSQKHIKETDYAGIYSGKNEDKIKKLGLTAVKSEIVNAPYIEEFPINIECKLKQMVELGLHTQFIGEIVDVKASEDALNDEGKTDINKIKPFVYTPDKHYFAIGDKLDRAFSVGSELK
jgi:flavin reductase (DIM6/NTAB) family NADH-FMN oxidoreductase RutF